MSLLIIQPDLTSKEAHEWLLEVFRQIIAAVDPDDDDLAIWAESMSYKDVDAIFEKAMKGLLE